MYTRIALGKSSAMDVVGGESSGSAGQLLLLYPMLFALQGLQVRDCSLSQLPRSQWLMGWQLMSLAWLLVAVVLPV
jgi:hypothetical protein